jgi:hypothetical protein
VLTFGQVGNFIQREALAVMMLFHFSGTIFSNILYVCQQISIVKLLKRMKYLPYINIPVRVKKLQLNILMFAVSRIVMELSPISEDNQFNEISDLYAIFLVISFVKYLTKKTVTYKVDKIKTSKNVSYSVFGTPTKFKAHLAKIVEQS